MADEIWLCMAKNYPLLGLSLRLAARWRQDLRESFLGGAQVVVPLVNGLIDGASHYCC